GGFYIFAGLFPPSAAEDFPLGFFPAGEDRFVLDDDRAIEAIGRHGAQYPFGEGFAADQHDLMAARVMADDIENALQARAVGADRLCPEFLDILPISLRIDLVHHVRLRRFHAAQPAWLQAGAPRSR